MHWEKQKMCDSVYCSILFTAAVWNPIAQRNACPICGTFNNGRVGNSDWPIPCGQFENWERYFLKCASRHIKASKVVNIYKAKFWKRM